MESLSVKYEFMANCPKISLFSALMTACSLSTPRPSLQPRMPCHLTSLNDTTDHAKSKEMAQPYYYHQPLRNGILGCKLGRGVDNEHAVMRAENREIFGGAVAM